MKQPLQRVLTKYLCLIGLLLFLSQSAFSQKGMIYGKLSDIQGNPSKDIHVTLGNTPFTTTTDGNGNYILMDIPYGQYDIEFIGEGFGFETETIQLNSEKTVVNKTLKNKIRVYDDLEVFGDRDKQPEKLDVITRLPLKPYEMIQSVSVISEKTIQQQGNLSIAEATRNVPGVYTYATYGGIRESMSSRGFRGIPIVKNGIRIQTDFRGTGFATDFAGVESIQVLKGASSISMGTATDLGSPGGVINIVTKTPKFENSGVVGIRVGSFNQFRPTFDVQNIIGKEGKFAIRVNGAYENTRTFQNIKGIGQEKFYINPSVAWKPDARTLVVLEMDHLNDTRSFDPGTVNTSIGNETNEIYDLGRKFLGFKGNDAIQKTTTFTTTFKRYLTNKLYLRAGYYFANLNSDAVVSALSAVKKDDDLGINVDMNTVYRRSLNRSNDRQDKSHVVQIDFIGEKIQHGIFKHTFQVGFDYRTSTYNSNSYNSYVIDTINITQNVNNTLPNNVGTFNIIGSEASTSRSFGLSAQEVFQITDYVRIFGGLRFGTHLSYTPDFNSIISGSYWNPVAGVMVKVWKGINVFGSYTNSTNPRSAAYLDVNGNALGNERIDQIELGLKTSWFQDRLRFNATFYKINNKNMNIRAAILNESTGVVELQNYYFKGGNDQRQGVELELTGRPIENLDVILGYSYIDARYVQHTTFVPGSSPNNTPNHTLNAYVNYNFTKTAVRGLSIGASFYYIGARYYNDWTQSNVQYHGITPNLEPWKNKAYSLLNVQIGYDFKYLKNEVLNNFNVRLLGNNLMNSIGYDAYRTSFINRVTPISFAMQLNYRF